MKLFLIILSVFVIGCNTTNPTSSDIQQTDTLYSAAVTTEGDTTGYYWRSIVSSTDTTVDLVNSEDSILIHMPPKDSIDWECLLRITCIE